MYFFYFASLGILLPYLGLYLQSLGYVAAQVGLVFAVIQGTKIIAPNIWAWLSNVQHGGMSMVRLAALLSCMAFSLMLLSNSLMTIIIISFLFSFFWNALLPQFEVVTLNLLGDATASYGRIRLWGSVGFIVAVTGGGWLLETVGLEYWPHITLLILGLVLSACFFVKSAERTTLSTSSTSMKSVLMDKQIIAFFTVLFLLQASHGPYYSFFSIVLNEQGYTESQVGQFWSLGVIAEIVLFLIMHHVLKQVSLRGALLISILLTMTRWLLMAWFVDSLPVLIIAQVLHAISFGAFHLICIQLVHQHFRGEHQIKGQALYSSIGFGAGGMCGSLLAGYFWEAIGQEWVFTIAAGISVVAYFVALKWIHPDEYPKKRLVEMGRFQE